MSVDFHQPEMIRKIGDGSESPRVARRSQLIALARILGLLDKETSYQLIREMKRDRHARTETRAEALEVLLATETMRPEHIQTLGEFATDLLDGLRTLRPELVPPPETFEPAEVLPLAEAHASTTQLVAETVETEISVASEPVSESPAGEPPVSESRSSNHIAPQAAVPEIDVDESQPAELAEPVVERPVVEPIEPSFAIEAEVEPTSDADIENLELTENAELNDAELNATELDDTETASDSAHRSNKQGRRRRSHHQRRSYGSAYDWEVTWESRLREFFRAPHRPVARLLSTAVNGSTAEQLPWAKALTWAGAVLVSCAAALGGWFWFSSDSKTRPNPGALAGSGSFDAASSVSAADSKTGVEPLGATPSASDQAVWNRDPRLRELLTHLESENIDEALSSLEKVQADIALNAPLDLTADATARLANELEQLKISLLIAAGDGVSNASAGRLLLDNPNTESETWRLQFASWLVFTRDGEWELARAAVFNQITERRDEHFRLKAWVQARAGETKYALQILDELPSGPMEAGDLLYRATARLKSQATAGALEDLDACRAKLKVLQDEFRNTESFADYQARRLCGPRLLMTTARLTEAILSDENE